MPDRLAELFLGPRHDPPLLARASRSARSQAPNVFLYGSIRGRDAMATGECELAPGVRQTEHPATAPGRPRRHRPAPCRGLAVLHWASSTAAPRRPGERVTCGPSHWGLAVKRDVSQRAPVPWITAEGVRDRMARSRANDQFST